MIRPFHPHSGARLLEVDAHHDAQIGRELVDRRLKVLGIFAGSLCVVDGAGSDEHEHAGIQLGKDARNLKARIEDGGRRRFIGGAFFSRKTGGRTTLVHLMRRSSVGWNMSRFY